MLGWRALFPTRLPVHPATATTVPLVLASSSKYRRELLERLGLPFEAVVPGIDETPEPGEAPQHLTLRLALAKAQAVAERRRGCIVIASDQVASQGGRILGKPGTEANAVAMLESLSGRSVTFWTSLVVANAGGGPAHRHVDETRVFFRRLATEEIRHYVALERPLDCAGAIKSEGRGVLLFERMETEDPTALIGLPLIRLGAMLRAEGVGVLGEGAG